MDFFKIQLGSLTQKVIILFMDFGSVIIIRAFVKEA